jgi:hypothetical protein
MALFRTEKPKQFTYIPRFYDERKEELQNRMGEIKKEMEENSEGQQYVPNIRGRMRSRHEALYGKSGKAGKSMVGKRMITIIFIAMILLIGYYILRMLTIADKI